MMSWPVFSLTCVVQVLSALHSASALSNAAFGYFGARMYVFFAMVSRLPVSLIGCVATPFGWSVSFDFTHGWSFSLTPNALGGGAARPGVPFATASSMALRLNSEA